MFSTLSINTVRLSWAQDRLVDRVIEAAQPSDKAPTNLLLHSVRRPGQMPRCTYLEPRNPRVDVKPIAGALWPRDGGWP